MEWYISSFGTDADNSEMANYVGGEGHLRFAIRKLKDGSLRLDDRTLGMRILHSSHCSLSPSCVVTFLIAGRSTAVATVILLPAIVVVEANLRVSRARSLWLIQLASFFEHRLAAKQVLHCPLKASPSGNRGCGSKQFKRVWTLSCVLCGHS